jgi:isocitrate/isopropylmalate dehydrogenase
LIKPHIHHENKTWPRLADAFANVHPACLPAPPLSWHPLTRRSLPARFDDVSGSTKDGKPVSEVPRTVMESIRRNKVCLKGTLFTPLSKHNTSTQSLNVQMRKELECYVNLVHGFSIDGIKTRYDDLDIVVIR